jgi:hypothetical protein
VLGGSTLACSLINALLTSFWDGTRLKEGVSWNAMIGQVTRIDDTRLMPKK